MCVTEHIKILVVKMCTGLVQILIRSGVGFAELVKRFYLQQLGYKTFRYFRMTQTK